MKTKNKVGVKQQVKNGEITAQAGIKKLEAAAKRKNGTGLAVLRGSEAYQWLQRRARTESIKGIEAEA